ncbi:hypothetical protein B0H10DRAFT_1970977 [Mycena sp. CBHHK59/15]|nr:hypothetical protein B0H10DRAFT_1970977 [Mycena sp. CBHHK59/15]
MLFFYHLVHNWIFQLDTSDHNDTLDPSPRYTWKGGDDLEKAQLALKRANLVFVVDVNVTGPIFETIDSAFQAHCQTHNISYVAASTAAGSVETPNTKSWVLLRPRGHSGARTWVEDPKCLTRFTFTLLALRNIPFSYMVGDATSCQVAILQILGRK